MDKEQGDQSDRQAFDVLCVRYLSGDASSDERKTLVEALRAPAQRQRFETLRLIWDNASRPAPESVNVDAALARLKLPPDKDSSAAAPMVERKPWWRGRRLVWAVALVAAVVSIVGVALPGPWRIATEDSDRVTWIEHHSPDGKQSEFVLLDGTRIRLNSGSSVWVPDTFQQARRVRLEGEALFTVAHNDAEPFVLLAGDLRVTVLGTTFDASCYGGGEASSVSLIEGRLLVSQETDGASNDALLLPGQQYLFDPATMQSKVQQFDRESVVAWMENRLVFKKEPIDSAIRKIERRYGVRVILATPELGEGTITARVDREGLEEVLEIVAFAAHARYRVERTGGGVVRVVFEEAE